MVAVWFPSSLCPYGYVADPNTFSFLWDEESQCSSLFISSTFLQTHPQTLWLYLWPSTFWAILPYMWSSIPAPSPTLTLYGKGTWGMSVNGTWLKKFIYIYKHAAFFCTWICIFETWSPEEWPESFVIVVMCAWNTVPKPSVLTESCLSTYGALGLLDCKRTLGSLLQHARLG